MWYKTLEIEYQNQKEKVIVFLSGTTENEQEEVTIQSMKNGYYFIQKVYFTNNDDANMFIQCYTKAQAKLFFKKEGMNIGVVEPEQIEYKKPLRYELNVC